MTFRCVARNEMTSADPCLSYDSEVYAGCRDRPLYTEAEPASVAPTTASRSSFDAPLQKQGGTFVILILINNSITLPAVLDSGATDVAIPADVLLTLMRTGTITSADFFAEKDLYVDRRIVPSVSAFSIRSLKVGGTVLQNVTVSVSPVKGDLLLGQSFLSRFKSWSIDNKRQVLVLEQ